MPRLKLVPAVTLLPERAADRPQCQLSSDDLAPTTSKFFSRYRATSAERTGRVADQCMRHAKWSVGGKLMCTQHAGMHLLELLKQ